MWVVWLVARLGDWFVGWLVDRLIGCLGGWLIVQSVLLLVCHSVGWLADR